MLGIAHRAHNSTDAHFTTFGDSCLEGAGGYSTSLGFWWHLPFPDEIKSRTLLRKNNNKDGMLISINVLEFVTVIINYCAALHVVLGPRMSLKTDTQSSSTSPITCPH